MYDGNMKKKLKLIIAEAFKQWEKNATKKELEEFCRDMNAVSAVLRDSYNKRR